MRIETFEMERTQCLFENKVELNLSESGVLPLKVSELLDGTDDAERFVANKLCYSESDGSQILREHIAQFYPDCQPGNIKVTNGGSEANYNLPIDSTDLINRLIQEKSTLLTPSNHFGLDRGIRVGFGYDVEKSLTGLSHAEALMRTMT